MSTGEPAATESGHGWFGGGPPEKDQATWHLADGLPYCTPGLEGGRPEKARVHRDLAGWPTLPLQPGPTAADQRVRR